MACGIAGRGRPTGASEAAQRGSCGGTGLSGPAYTIPTMITSPFLRIDTAFIKLDDPHAAAAWYCDVLGWSEAFRTEHIVVLRSPEGAPVTLLNPGGGEWSGFNFYAPDAQAAHDWLTQRGVKTGPLNRAEDQPVTWFWFLDPEGN